MAVKALQEIVGGDMIFESEASLGEYAKDMSIAPGIRPRCVVKLQNAEQVEKLVQWANATSTSLVPVSSGAPHFRGDTVPSVGGAVIVDLSNLKKMVRIDAENRIAMIEAGVTFGELVPKLKEAGIRLNMPLLPRANKSVVTSMLDREPVMMPVYQWDSQDPLTCTEVIFGNGDMFRTGSAAGPGTLEQQWAARQAQVNPMGPGQTTFGNVLQGAQGTLGIVTWATVRCEELPVLQEGFLVGADNYEILSDMAYRVMWWKSCEECLILDRNNLAAALADSPETYEKLKSSLPPWILFVALAGFSYFPEEKIAYVKKALGEEAKKLGLSMEKAIGDLSADEVLNLLQSPSAEPYWKIRRTGACQEIFFTTTMDRVSKFIGIMAEEASRSGFDAADMGVYVQPMVQGTSCQCEFDLFYDPKKTSEVAKVTALYESAAAALMNGGAYFSRPYGSIVDEVYRRNAETTVALRKMKQIFDPNNVMNAGRLCF